MKSIKVLIVIAVITLVSSCDNREDFFYTNNKQPELFWKDNINPKEINDSIKIGYPREFVFELRDDQDNDTLLVMKDFGGSLNSSINKVLGIIEVETLGEGPYILYLLAVDHYSVSDTINLNLVSFSNLPPIASLRVQQISDGDNLVIELDGSLSRDKDTKYGGHIVQYEFRIGNNYTVTSEVDKIRYVFAETGTYRVSLKVKDNNNTWSNEYKLDIEIK